MFCPRCRAEYIEGVTRCADCDVDLVAALPHEFEVTWTDLVTVLTPSNGAQLLVAKSLLAGAGIAYYVANERSQGVLGLGHYNTAIGPPRLQVRPEDRDEAMALLAELRQEAGEA